MYAMKTNIKMMVTMMSYDDDYGCTNYDVDGTCRRSMFELDRDGRVLRFDSLSKFIAPGMRFGWISGPQAFVQRYQLLQEMTCQYPAGLSQSVLLGLLRHWGEEGLHQQVIKV